MRITDAQIHLWTLDQGPPHHWRRPFSIEHALQDMAEAGIDSAINHPPNWDPESIDYAVEAARLHPDRFATLGWFPLDDAADETRVDDLMEREGMRGLRFILALPELDERLRSGKLDWLWSAANQRELAVGLFVLPAQLPAIGDIAARHPRMRILIDHLGVLPFAKLPAAAEHFESLMDLARQPNVAVKATGVPSMATEDYPFADTHDLLRRTFDAFGAERMFWGSDITRLHCSWRECVSLFTEELPWLKGSDLELVMGGGVRSWIGWP
jgi:predicted TIM-barrel fold metal-dependent hydrolase